MTKIDQKTIKTAELLYKKLKDFIPILTNAELVNLNKDVLKELNSRVNDLSFKGDL